MARYYRRRYRTIVRAPKKKWGSNMMNVNMNIVNTSGETAAGYSGIVLAQNKTETNAPTPVIVKTGNFKLQADLHFAGGSGGSNVAATLYIVYVPQGVDPQTVVAAETLIQNHPEWIIAWRVLDGGLTTASGLDSSRFTVSSRLKRNLNSGDTIYALLIAENLNPNQGLLVKGKCQFWTCAN